MGIGTSSLSYKFQVEGGRALFTPTSESYAVGVRFNSSTNGVWLGSPSANAFQISNFGGSAYLNIDNNGNVGIGNSSPAHKLSVTGTANISGNANIGNLGTAQVLASANITTPQFISNIATGTAPFIVSSNTVVANLNADLLDGYTTSSANTANTIALRDASGNVNANYFIGNGSQLTGLSTSSISNGNSNVSIPAANGNVNISSAGNANILVVTGSGVVASSLTIGIGTINSSAKIQVFDGAIMPATGQGLNNGILFPPDPGGGSGDYAWIRHYAVTPGGENTVLEIGISNDPNDNIALMPTGNVGIGTVSPSSRFHVANGSANISGSITVNSDAVATAIINGAGNAIGNIGSSTTYFNQVFAQATSALYADLAEMYVSDAEYAPGTVLEFGGQQEVTLSTTDSSRRVAGVVSTHPAHIMNSGLQAEHSVAVALTGRVPTLVVGIVSKGDMMISAGNGKARADENPVLGSVIGKALENFNGTEGVIEIVIRRL
jgi:hypothetical protein